MQAKIKRVWPEWELDALAPDHGILGAGSFGDVYRIRRSVHGITEYAALKVLTIPRDAREHNLLKQEYHTDEQLSNYYQEVKQSFETEYATMVLLRGHANIVYCDDIRFDPHGDNQGWDIHIKMELLAPMAKQLPSRSSEELARKLGIDICRALVFCHKMGIIHRDIKPQNIFLSRDDHFKLGDFGIAKHMEGTQLGTIAGTEDYMAPEVNFFQPYSSQADIYSLGLVMYWMLNDYVGPFLNAESGKPSFSKKMEARTKRLSGASLPQPAHGSAMLKKIVLKACAFEQKDRFRSASDMLQALLALESNDDTIYDPAEQDTLRVSHAPVTPAASQGDDATVCEAQPQTKTVHASEPYAYRPPRKNAVTEIPSRPEPANQATGKKVASEPYVYVPPKKEPVSPTAGRKVESAPYSYVPPKKDPVTQTAGKKVESEPYSYIPPRKAVYQTTPDKNSNSESYSYVPPRPANTQAKTATGTATPKTATPSSTSPRPKKKKRKSPLLRILLLVGLVAAAYFIATSPTVYLNETVTYTSGNDSISLLEVGSIEDPTGKFYFYDYISELFPGEDGFPWYTLSGEKMDEYQFDKILYLGNGLYHCKHKSDSVNNSSLFTQYGEVLSLQDSCLIEWAPNQDESAPRYLFMYTADEITNDKSSCMVSFNTDYSYVTTGPYKDIMYSGTIRIYDTALMQFVPNLPVITNYKDVTICKNTIVIKSEDGTHTIYSESGEVIGETYSDLTVHNGYMIGYNDGTTYVLDEFGECTYTTNYTLSTIDSTIPYLILITSYDEPRKIVDLYGNVILEGYNVTDYHDGMFVVYAEGFMDQTKYGLITVQGKEILPCKYDYIYGIHNGYCIANYRNNHTLVNSDGILATNLKRSPYDLFIEDNEDIFVVNNRSYDLHAGDRNVRKITTGVVTIESETTGLLTVYDLFTGKALLPYEYEKVAYCADHLFVYRNGEWGVFELHFLQDGMAY